MVKDERYTFRFMTADDLEAVMVIERDAFTVPWDEAVLKNELTSNQFAHYIVLEDDEENRVIGYCGLWIVMDDAQITNIAVHSDYRGKKLGEHLLRYVMTYVWHMGGTTLSLEVRVSNDVAQGLYRKVGFQDGGIRKNYYADNSEDALVMWVNKNGEKRNHLSD